MIFSEDCEVCACFSKWDICGHGKQPPPPVLPLMSGGYFCKWERGSVSGRYFVSEASLLKFFTLVPVVTVACLTDCAAVCFTSPEEGTGLCLSRHPQPETWLHGCVVVLRSVLNQWTHKVDVRLYSRLSPGISGFRVALDACDESFPLFLQVRRSVDTFPSPACCCSCWGEHGKAPYSLPWGVGSDHVRTKTHYVLVLELFWPWGLVVRRLSDIDALCHLSCV